MATMAGIFVTNPASGRDARGLVSRGSPPHRPRQPIGGSQLPTHMARWRHGQSWSSAGRSYGRDIRRSSSRR